MKLEEMADNCKEARTRSFYGFVPKKIEISYKGEIVANAGSCYDVSKIFDLNKSRVSKACKNGSLMKGKWGVKYVD